LKANVIKDTLGAVLKEVGFRRKGSDWFLDTDDAVLVVNLQKSNFGDQYYVNLAIWLRALGDATMPKEQQCHVRTRVTALDLDRQRYWETEVFNLEADLPDAERGTLIRSLMETKVLPFLLRCGTLSGLKEAQRKGQLRGAAIMARAQPFLEV
jgi:hypothetical protein